MPRIRSIHPDFFTDEDLVQASMEARLLLIGLGVQADDKGTGPWKPITLKMRIFPADNVDVAALMQELCDVDAIMQYECGGRQFYAIRNFRRHQRPKSPNDIHPLPLTIRNYVGLPVTSGENEQSETMQIPTNGEIAQNDERVIPESAEMSIQMEDGGEEIEDTNVSSSIVQIAPKLGFDDFWAVWPNKKSKADAKKAWGTLKAHERKLAVDGVTSWFAAWRREYPTASPILPATYLRKRRWEDEFAASQQAGDTPFDPEARLRSIADTIKSGKSFLCAHIASTDARECVSRGLVTEAECMAVLPGFSKSERLAQ